MRRRFQWLRGMVAINQGNASHGAKPRAEARPRTSNLADRGLANGRDRGLIVIITIIIWGWPRLESAAQSRSWAGPDRRDASRAREDVKEWAAALRHKVGSRSNNKKQERR